MPGEKWLTAVIAGGILLLSTTCSKWDIPDWDIGVAAPLIKTTLHLSHIIPSDYLTSDNDQQGTVEYRHQVYTLDPDELFDMEQSITDLAYNIPFTLTLNPGQHFISTLEETDFGFQNTEIRSITIGSGLIHLVLTNPITEKVVCEYAIPGSSKNGKPLTITATIPAAVAGIPGIKEMDVDLSGYNLDMTGTSGMAANRITVKIDTRIHEDAQPVQVTPFDTLKIRASITGFSLQEAHGYFGQHEFLSGLQETRMDLFDLFETGTLEPDTITAQITMHNGAGMDLQLMIKEITARNSKSHSSVTLNDPFIDVPINVGRATRNAITGTIVPTVQTIRFDPSITKQMFSIFPDYLDWELDMTVNPMGNITMGNDFLHEDHPVAAWFELLIPLRFSSQGLTLKQDVDFYYGTSQVIDGIVYLIADNRFPFDATITMMLFDEQGTLLDSLKPAGIIRSGDHALPAAPVPTRTVITIPCDQERIALLTRTQKIGLEVVLDTQPVGESVSLRVDDYLQIIVSANINTTLSP